MTLNELLLVMQPRCDFGGVLCVNLFLTPVAMDVPVGRASLLLRPEWLMKLADR